jgi:NDP-sugar pyrophosphorylase family protein
MSAMKALVLCGGFGTRLGALTEDTPKPLLPLDEEGRPLLAYTLAWLARHRVRDVAINLHFLGDRIEAAVGDGAALGVRVRYEREASLLGTAGTVRALASWFGDDDALVVYGDLLLDEDLGAMRACHAQRAADATLLLHRRAQSNSVVTMDADGRITAFLERPRDDDPSRASDGRETWVNSGVAILGRAVRERIPAERVPCDLPRDVYAPLVAAGARLHGYPLRGYRCAIDSPERYEEARRAVRDGVLRV